MGLIVYILGLVAFFFWLAQLIDVLFREQRYFESHTHKLVWFLVVFVGNIVGAAWYFLWKRQVVEAHDIARSQRQLEEEAEAWRQDESTLTAEPAPPAYPEGRADAPSGSAEA